MAMKFAEAAKLIKAKYGLQALPTSMAQIRQIIASSPDGGIGLPSLEANKGGVIKADEGTFVHSHPHQTIDELNSAYQSGELTGTDAANAFNAFTERTNASNVARQTTIDEEANRVATLSQEEKIKELADLTYLAQNTGVDSVKMNAAYESLGIDTSDDFAFVKAQKILEGAGYQPGEQTNFYGNNVAEDTAAQILNERWQQAPTDGSMVINDTVANQTYLSNALASQGVDVSDTNASLHTLSDPQFQNIDAYRVSNDQKYSTMTGENAGRSTANEFDMLEWDLEKTQNNSNTGNTGSTVTGNTGPTVTGTDVPAYTPTTTPFTPATPYQPVTGGVGTTEVGLPTYENQFVNQGLDFAQRGLAQQSYMQPQTVAEQQAAGTGDFSGKIEQRQYQNRQGMVQYITFINGKAQQPIPQGYSPVATAAQGMYVQGYQEGGYNVNKPIQTGAANLTAEQIAQAQSDAQAQAFVNPAGAIAAAPVANVDPNAAGTVMGADTGQALPVAPIVDANQIAQVQEVTQATMPTFGTTPSSETTKQSDFESNEDYLKFLNTPFEGIDLSSVAEGSKQYATPQLSMTGPLPKGYYSGPLDGVYKYGEGPYAKETQGFLDSVSQTIDQFIGGPKTGSTKPTATGTQTDIKGMTFDPATSEYTSQPVIGGDGKPVMEAVVDAQGNPVYEADGTTPKMKPKMQTALSDAATITGQQATGTSVSGVEAAQLGQPILDVDGKPVLDADGKLTYDTKAQTVQDAPTRTLQETREPLKDAAGKNITDADGNIMYKGSELVSGSAVDQAKVGDAFGTGEIAAASVQDELTILMNAFEGGNTPAWAAGSMRKANQMLAARGLGASSMGGQAIIQAAMEAALPIAQIDAGNKQQMALFKGEQRAKFLQIEFDQDFQSKIINASKVSEIANMNFNADQQIALENARMAQTVDLANLSNSQAVVMAEAASLANLDMANLSNLQQAAVQNAQNFLQMDMTNLANSQQMEMFKQQTLANSILTDAAADNAMAQFNSTSEQQRDQFMTSMASQVSQFNSSQTNAMKQFNANEAHAMTKYNSEIQNQREMFNAQQYAVIAQANAKWRQDTVTMNTAAANQSNFEFAKQANGLTNKVLDQIWQRERDIMNFGVAQSESALERATALLLGDKELDEVRIKADGMEDAAKTSFFTKLLFGKAFG